MPFAARGGFLYQEESVPVGGFGNNALFPGANDQFVHTNSTTDLINWKNTNGFTIEYWIRYNDLSAEVSEISGGPGNQNGVGTNYWSFGAALSGSLTFYFWSPGLTFIRTATGAITNNQWYNVCAVMTTSGSNSTVSLYINGVRQQVQLNTGAFADSQTVSTGITDTGTVFGMGKYSGVWNAHMDNLRVSNINRYSGASYSLATSPFTSDANTQLLLINDGTPGSTTLTDSSSFNRTITNDNNRVTISSTYANHS